MGRQLISHGSRLHQPNHSIQMLPHETPASLIAEIEPYQFHVTASRILPSSIGLDWVLLDFTGFYWVLLGFTGFYWILLDFTGFYLVLLGFTGFYWVLLARGRTSCINPFTCSHTRRRLPLLQKLSHTSSTYQDRGSNWVLPSFTGFLLGRTYSGRVLLNLTEFHWVLLGFTGLNWV